MKKIAIFVEDLSLGGIQRSLINILNVIDYSKYSIDLYMTRNNIFYNDLNDNVNICYLKPTLYIFKFINFDLARKIASLYYKIPDIEYDISIDFNTYQFSCSYYALSVKAKRYISWIHNDIKEEALSNKKYNILHRFMLSKYKYFDEYVGVSEGAIDSFKQMHKLYNKKYYCIQNLINTKDIFDKSKEKVDLKIDKNKYNLISVGRLIYQKGFDILIEDMHELIKEREDVHLYILGDGEDKDKLIKQIKYNELDDFITMLGSTSNPFKYEMMMDGFVLESRYEGQGMAILEAYSLGLDIFIPKRIEKYNGYNIKGCNNIVDSIKNSKKHKKKLDDLSNYNSNIIENLNKLFEDSF